ncbi:hypothetical protein MUK42_30585 [Musa troglodytarum]|uniref:Uncharacterized protein n=1 Tax=Musa troglodytarum TaxID=320322 RepID=A0A9E7EXW6_9LILI|nr:hypothetical protein MUK42_30585 [Musa troglodytarum]
MTLELFYADSQQEASTGTAVAAAAVAASSANHTKADNLSTNTTRMWIILESVQQEMKFDQKQGKSLTITPKDHGDSSYKVSKCRSPARKRGAKELTSLTFLRVKAPATGQSLPKRVRFHNAEKDTSPAAPTKLEETFFFLRSCETDRCSSVRQR